MAALGDGSSVSSIPYEQSDEFQNLRRTPSVDFHKGHGISQWFRGTVGTNSTVSLHTSPVSLNSYSMGLLSGGTSTLRISASNNSSMTGAELSDSNGKKPKPGLGPARQAIERVKKLNKIQSIIRAPIDQNLEMEIAFGSYHSSNTWKGTYTNGGTYEIITQGVAPVALIRLTCRNPLNPGWFNFQAAIHIKPPATAAPHASPAKKNSNQMDELRRGFGEMIRNIQSGRDPW